MRRKLIRILLLVLLLCSASLQAAQQVISSGEHRTNVVELFTSEGCSSCPPAEAWLNGLLNHQALWQQVVPLAFHVDYWDYIGWQDRFAQKRFSRRQYQYKNEGGIRTVYTPGVLVNGREWRGWYRGQSIPIEGDRPGVLQLTIDDEVVQAHFKAMQDIAEPLRLNLAVLAFGLDTKVGAGENRGRNLTHEFVVVGFDSVEADGMSWRTRLPKITPTDAKRHALVAWVSAKGKQAPIQAAGGWLE